MVKTKGYNWQARRVVETVIDNSKTKEIKLDLKVNKNGQYDTCNTIALPSEKRKTKIKKDKVEIKKLLSKSQRKKLEKVVERKHKKQNRASLLEALSKVQATPEELKQFTSISALQTKGLKKYFQEIEYDKSVTDSAQNEPIKLNSIAGATKRKRLLGNISMKKTKNEIADPNIVGFDNESSEEETSSSDDEIISDKEINNEKQSDQVENIEKIQKNEITDLNIVGFDNGSSEVEIISDKEVNSEKQSDQVENIEKIQQTNEIKESEVINPKIKPLPKPAVYVDVLRTPEIQAARLKLPILAEEQIIMETINENQVIIIAGETGSGKTTQVPQFLYEAGYAKQKLIGVTEPRRVAAISMSKRVAEEMNLTSKEVSYLIRFEGNVTEETKIKFMTDGVLLKEVQSDFLLSKYSVIILDEAHERSVYTDILIGLLSRIVPLRCKRNTPLKLIVMSATLRIQDFTENKRLFKIPPPVINVESRQFPVTIHFNRQTNSDYLKEALKKTIKIHTQLPEGGILVFVTGQREVNYLVRKLRRLFTFKYNKHTINRNKSEQETQESDSDVELGLMKSLKRTKSKNKQTIKLPEINLDNYNVPAEADDLVSVGSASEYEEDADDNDINLSISSNSQPLWTLPLYSLLPTQKQQLVFEPPPEGCRLCVISTNVAETSLTIPNVKYVVDSGRTKVRLYDKVTGVSAYDVTWTSKASADQRAGRAGRTGPGHCYRLYSSAVFNDTFKQFAIPEIQQKPVDDLYLQMKCMNIDKVVNFPFPSAPNLLQLKTAETRLTVLGALEEKKHLQTFKVTPLGHAISKFPVLPRFGKMLALSHQQNLLAYTICMVAALSVQEVLLETPIYSTSDEECKAIRKKWTMIRRSWAGQGNTLLLGDPVILLKAVGAAEYANSKGQLETFCKENGLRQKAVIEIRKLRIQLTNEIKSNMPEVELNVDPQMQPPNDLQAKLLRQILLSGMGDQVAKKVNLDEITDRQEKVKLKHAYHTSLMEEPVFIHSSSILRKKDPEWVVYQEIYETNKMYMRGVTAIEPEWLPIYAPTSCNLGDTLLNPEPKYDKKKDKMYCTVSGTFGKQGWELPYVEVPFPDGINKYKWFAKCLLEGAVFEKLNKYKNILLSTPSTMTKSWSKLHPRTDVFLKTLMLKEACTKSKIIEIWENEPQYLLAAYQKWIPESAHNEVALIWPPIEK